MTVRSKLSKTAITEIELELANHDYSRIRSYGDDAVYFHLLDQSELIRRKKIVHNNCNGDLECIYLYAILCVATDDLRGWQKVERVLEESFPPELGALAWNFLCHQTSDPDILKKWEFILEKSAELGHIPSQLKCLKTEKSNLGLLGRLGLPFKILRLRIKIFSIARKDIRDPRVVHTFGTHPYVAR